MSLTFRGLKNGFPFRVEHVTGADEAAAGVGSNTNYPIAMSLYHAVEIYWRWREFVSQLDVEEDFSGSPFITTTNGLVGRNNYVSIESIDHEYQLIDKNAGWDDNSNPETIGIFRTFDAIGFGQGAFRKYNGLYYPQFQWLDASRFFNLSTTAGDDSGAELQEGTLTMSDGTVYIFDIWWVNSGGGETLVSFSLNIQASAYWGYGGKFNTTTGARI